MKSMKAGIGVTDPTGARKVYTVKTWEDMTIADWRKLTSPQLPDMQGSDMLIELLSRHCTIPKKTLRMMPAKEVARLMEAIEALNVQAAEAQAKAEATDPPTSFVHKGATYIVPKDIENEVGFGQFEDLEKVVLPKCETDADVHKAVLAFLCLPEGERYDSSKAMERYAAFESVPMSLSVRVYAFFFGSSELFRSVMFRYSISPRTTKQPNAGPELSGTSSVTDPS